MDIDATGEWARPYDIPDDEIILSPEDEAAHREVVKEALACQGTPLSDWVPTMPEPIELSSDAVKLLFVGAEEVLRLRGVIERIQKHAYDGDTVFVICREELGHE